MGFNRDESALAPAARELDGGAGYEASLSSNRAMVEHVDVNMDVNLNEDIEVVEVVAEFAV